MDFIIMLLCIVGACLLFGFFKNRFSPPKQKKKAPAAKPAPRPTPKPAAPAPIVSNDPTWMSVTNVPGYKEKPGQPIYLNVLNRVELLIKQNIPDFMVVCYQRPKGKGFVVPDAIAKLPKHPRYIPGQTIGVISAQGKIFCIDLQPYTITDQTRKNFCKLLAQRLGCGCQLFTAQLPNTKGTQVERILGCILSEHVDAADVPSTQFADGEDGGVEPIPIAVTTFEWEEIDEEE